MNAPRLTLRQLQIFAAVARSGSTTAAGEAIGLSQSATSAALKELERLLSMPLFDRSGKRLILNDNGRGLLPGALALLDGAIGLEQQARDDASARLLRIGASTTIGNYRLPSLLARFHAGLGGRPTAWRASVMIGNTARIVADVGAFELDIGLIEGPCHDPDVVATPWIRDELVIVGPPGSAPRRDLSGLQQAIWLLRESGSGTREITDHLLLPHLGIRSQAIELGSSEAIKRAVSEGLGLACLSRWVVEDLLAAGRLVALITPLPPLVRQCYCIMHRDKQPTPSLAAFIALAQAMD